MHQPQVTVVVPTRNRADLLRMTLRSVLAQRNVDLEIVVVDEASSDHTPELLQTLVERLPDGRLHTVRHAQPKGVSAARNAGLEMARGEWVSFVDDDDLWTPDKLSGQVRAATTEGARWAYSGAVQFLPDLRAWAVLGSPEVEEVCRHLPSGNNVPACASNILMQRSAFASVGGFDTGLQILADWDAALRMLVIGPPARDPALTVAYRLHSGTMSVDNDDLLLREAEVIDSRYRDLRGGPLGLADLHRWLATTYWRTGQLRTARHHQRQAVVHGEPLSRLGRLRSYIPITRLRRPGQPPAEFTDWLVEAAVDG